MHVAPVHCPSRTRNEPTWAPEPAVQRVTELLLKPDWISNEVFCSLHSQDPVSALLLSANASNPITRQGAVSVSQEHRSKRVAANPLLLTPAHRKQNCHCRQKCSFREHHKPSMKYHWNSIYCTSWEKHWTKPCPYRGTSSANSTALNQNLTKNTLKQTPTPLQALQFSIYKAKPKEFFLALGRSPSHFFWQISRSCFLMFFSQFTSRCLELDPWHTCGHVQVPVSCPEITHQM